MYFLGKINQWDFFQHERCQVVIFQTFALYSGPMPSRHALGPALGSTGGQGSQGTWWNFFFCLVPVTAVAGDVFIVII